MIGQFPSAATRIWNGIESPEPPALVNEYRDLLEMAETMLANRRKTFPDLIASGEIDAGEAERQLLLFEELAGEWQWIVTGEGMPGWSGNLPARRAALDASLVTIANIARQRGGFSTSLEHQAHCVIALRWHAQDRRVLTLAARNHALRGTAPQPETADAA
jgi:hypothetical protein